MELRAVKPIQLTNYPDIEVKRYLSYAEIQNIVNHVLTLEEQDWSSREAVIDMMLVYYATNLSKEEVDNLGHTALLESGIIDSVKGILKNEKMIYKALGYHESIGRSLLVLADKIPELAALMNYINKE